MKLLYKDHPRNQQNVVHTQVVFICRLNSMESIHLRTWCLYKQVAFIYRWSLEQVWLYDSSPPASPRWRTSQTETGTALSVSRGPLGRRAVWSVGRWGPSWRNATSVLALSTSSAWSRRCPGCQRSGPAPCVFRERYLCHWLVCGVIENWREKFFLVMKGLLHLEGGWGFLGSTGFLKQEETSIARMDDIKV